MVFTSSWLNCYEFIQQKPQAAALEKLLDAHFVLLHAHGNRLSDPTGLGQKSTGTRFIGHVMR